MQPEAVLPVSTQKEQKSTATRELELFGVRFFYSLSPMDARLLAQEKKLTTLDDDIKNLRRLVVFYLLEHKPQVDKLAALCKAESYFTELKKGYFDFTNISMNLSAEAEIEFVGDVQSQKGKDAFRLLVGLDIILSIYNIQEIIVRFKKNKNLSTEELEYLMRDILLISRNLGLFVIVPNTKDRDAIDSEIAAHVQAERTANKIQTDNIRDYDARRHNKSYNKMCNVLELFHSEYFSLKEMPLAIGRSKGGSFNIKDHLIPFLEDIMRETGANDLPSVCAAIKTSCKETEPMTPGEMLFYWDDEPDIRSVRAAWLNSKKERKSEKIAIKTLDSYIKEVLRKAPDGKVS